MCLFMSLRMSVSSAEVLTGPSICGWVHGQVNGHPVRGETRRISASWTPPLKVMSWTTVSWCWNTDRCSRFRLHVQSKPPLKTTSWTALSWCWNPDRCARSRPHMQSKLKECCTRYGSQAHFSTLGLTTGVIITLKYLTTDPRVTAVARKRPQSFCQKCRWRVTP